MKKQRYFIRNMDAGTYLEIFLVSAVASILAIRAYLAITGYPQLGNSELHIAHMLWGGIFMLVGIIALAMFLGKAAQYVGVICGGIGFGTSGSTPEQNHGLTNAAACCTPDTSRRSSLSRSLPRESPGPANGRPEHCSTA